MKNNDCTCDVCKGACTFKPGWFMPDEIEKVAEYLGLSLQELFDTKIGVDWWVDDEDIFVLAPATINMSAGEEYPANPIGQCAFYENGLCSIHPVKPFECKKYHHTEQSAVNERHKSVADAWEKHQKQIVDLLGREPIAEEPESFFSFLLW